MGEIQSVFIVAQDSVCPLDSLWNLADMVPAAPDNWLFSWQGQDSAIWPMVKAKAMARINAVLTMWGWGMSFGHLFHIGSASFSLAQGANPEVIQIAGLRPGPSGGVAHMREVLCIYHMRRTSTSLSRWLPDT